MDTRAPEPAFREPLRQAIAFAGSQNELSRRCGIPQPTISWLLLTAEKISAEHAVAIERATEGRVTRHDLRPDLFEEPPSPVSRETPVHA